MFTSQTPEPAPYVAMLILRLLQSHSPHFVAPIMRPLYAPDRDQATARQRCWARADVHQPHVPSLVCPRGAATPILQQRTLAG